jgi:hypothetical protein
MAVMVTTAHILRCALWLEEVERGRLVDAIMMETGEDYSERDMLDLIAKLIESFGVIGAAAIVGCR